MQLRDYQSEILSKIEKEFESKQSTMLQLATGGGKTICFAELTRRFREKDKKVLILVHRKELITQTADKLSKLGVKCGYISSEYHYQYGYFVYVASVQTIVRRLDKLQFRPDLIITDEAHHSTADSYRKIYDTYPNAKHLGVSATPIRTNGKGFDDIFQSMVQGVDIKWLIENGFLVEPQIFARPLKIDLRKIKLTAGDYNEKDLMNAVDRVEFYAEYVRNWKAKANDKQTIIFAINIMHATNIKNIYKSEGINVAFISAETPKEERDGIINRFRNGSIKVLVNVGIATEGFDVPNVECVQLCRPTKSLSLYLQMVGRGLRPATNKEKAIVLDHANCVFEHGFPHTERHWTLKGIKRDKDKPMKKVLVRDKQTRMIYNITELPDDVQEIELIEVDENYERKAWLDQKFDEAKKKGYKVGWVWFRFIESFAKVGKNPDLSDIMYAQELLGYKKGWVEMQLKQFNINLNIN